MSESAKKLATPPLRDIWAAAKKKAEEEAKKQKLGDKFKTLDKKFDQDLGSGLEKWAGNYPDLGKLAAAKDKLAKTIETYVSSLAAAGLTPAVADPLKKSLSDLKFELARRLNLAKDYLSADEDEQRAHVLAKKKLQSVAVYAGDLTAVAVKEYGDKKPKDGKPAPLKEELRIVVVLDDPAVLGQVPAGQDEKAFAAALAKALDADRLAKDVGGQGLVAAAAAFAPDNADMAAARTAFETHLARAVAEALDRAAAEARAATKAAAAAKSFKAKHAYKLTATAAGEVMASGGLLHDAMKELTDSVRLAGRTAGEAKGAVDGSAQLAADIVRRSSEIASDILAIHSWAVKTRTHAADRPPASPLFAVLTTMKDRSRQLASVAKDQAGKAKQLASTLEALGKCQAVWRKAQTVLAEVGRPVLGTEGNESLTKSEKALDAAAAHLGELTGPVVQQLLSDVDTALGAHNFLASYLDGASGKRSAQDLLEVDEWFERAGIRVGDAVPPPHKGDHTELFVGFGKRLDGLIRVLIEAKAALDGVQAVVNRKAGGS